jgi:hypothetical protein
VSFEAITHRRQECNKINRREFFTLNPRVSVDFTCLFVLKE